MGCIVAVFACIQCAAFAAAYVYAGYLHVSCSMLAGVSGGPLLEAPLGVAPAALSNLYSTLVWKLTYIVVLASISTLTVKLVNKNILQIF